jgi:NADPH2:quinone reductase
VSDGAWGKIARVQKERSDEIVRAMVTPRFGGTDLFEERDVERPEPGAGEILVRVVAAGTNPVDAKFRAEGDSVGLEAPIVLGADISGVVEEIGPGVTDLAPGDEVYYTPEVFGPRSNGAYAEYHAARADIVARKPSTLSHEEAAAVPLAGGTAYEAVVRRLALRVGEGGGGPPSPSRSPRRRAHASLPRRAPTTRRSLRRWAPT